MVGSVMGRYPNQAEKRITMLKIRKLGQFLVQQNKKELQKSFQKETTLLCKKFGFSLIKVKIHILGLFFLLMYIFYFLP